MVAPAAAPRTMLGSSSACSGVTKMASSGRSASGAQPLLGSAGVASAVAGVCLSAGRPPRCRPALGRRPHCYQRSAPFRRSRCRRSDSGAPPRLHPCTTFWRAWRSRHSSHSPAGTLRADTSATCPDARLPMGWRSSHVPRTTSECAVGSVNADELSPRSTTWQAREPTSAAGPSFMSTPFLAMRWIFTVEGDCTQASIVRPP